MKNQIPFKALNKSLKLLFNATVEERSNDGIESMSRLTYVDILPSKASFWSGTQAVQVIREVAPVNSLTDNNADAFVQQAAQALYQLCFKIDKGMPASLEQQDKLWQNWMQHRLLLTETYTGDWVNRMLTTIDQKMLPSAGLLQTIMQDVFFNNYFRNLYEPQFNGGITQVNRTVSGLIPGVLPVHETWRLTETDKNFEVKFSGNWLEGNINEIQSRWFKSKNKQDLAGSPQISGSGYFTVNKETGWCSAFESTYTLNTGYDYEKTITTTLRSA